MKGQRGSAVVEFALVLPLLLAVLAASVEVVVVGRTQLELVHAAREGAREAAVATDPARAVAAVRAALPDDLGLRAVVAVSRPAAVGSRAVVTVRLRHRVAGVLAGGLTVELRARAVARVER